MGPLKKINSRGCFVIGVAGGSCSGKTILAERLVTVLGDRCSLIRQDNYYIDQSDKFDRDGGKVNFDHPSAIEFSLLARDLEKIKSGDNIEIPIYDFSKHVRVQDVALIEHRPYVVLEGTMVLRPPVDQFVDLKVYVNAQEDVRLKRRIERDTVERGREESGVRAQFTKQVQPMHEKYVEPQVQDAHIVLNNTGSEKDFLEEALQRIHAAIKGS